MEDKFITLWSSDGYGFIVSQELARESEILSSRITNNQEDNIWIHDVNAKILQKVIEYFERSTTGGMEGPIIWGPVRPDTPLNDWEKKFAKDLDSDTIHEIILAADNWRISGLLCLADRAQWHNMGVLEEMRKNPELTLTVHQRRRRMNTFSISTKPLSKNKRN